MSEVASLQFSLPFPDSHKMAAVALDILPLFTHDLEGQIHC